MSDKEVIVEGSGEKTPRPKSQKPKAVSFDNAVKQPDSTKAKRKRIGRGIGSGTGKTSGRGQKGQNSRSGGGVRIGFEGGQMPIHRRIPKSGFTNIFRKEYFPLNLDRLDKAGLTGELSPKIMAKKGLIPSEKSLVKVLAVGELSSPLTIIADKFSKSAEEKINKSGGKAIIRDRRAESKKSGDSEKAV